MAKIGYARASFTGQGLNLQLLKLQEFGCLEPNGLIFKEEHSTLDIEDRFALQLCLQRIRRGDMLVVTNLNRLTSSIVRMQEILNQIDQRGARLVALDQNINTRTLRGKLLLKYRLMRNKL